MIKSSILKQKCLNLYFALRDSDRQLLYLLIISLEITILIFLRLHFFVDQLNVKDSLSLILTINGLFSAILTTYFFNRISRSLDDKKDDFEEAIYYSQKITEFRRICKILTDYYGVWQNDKATKNLFSAGKYKNVDYFDHKLSSISDYVPEDMKIIEEMYANENYKEGQSDLYLGMISLVEDRKSNFKTFDSDLYKHFQKKGIYNYQFISNCVEIDYAGRMSYWFQKNYNFIQYHNLSAEHQKEILSAMERIDTKFIGAELNNKTMADLCDDMNEHYFKELLSLLANLNKGLSQLNLLIYTILISCLTIGVLIPFLVYFGFNDSDLKKVTTEILIATNFGLLLFFIVSLYRLVQKELTWT